MPDNDIKDLHLGVPSCDRDITMFRCEVLQVKENTWFSSFIKKKKTDEMLGLPPHDSIKFRFLFL